MCVYTLFTANEAHIISVKDIISSSLSLNFHVGKSYVQNILRPFELDVILNVLEEQMNQKQHSKAECRGFGRPIQRILTPL